jgi:hypothetical protein
LPSAVNANVFRDVPFAAAAMLWATQAAWRVACWAVGGQTSPVLVSRIARAVADGPQPRVVRDLEMRVDHDASALLLHRQHRHQRVRSRGHGADQRARLQAAAALEQGGVGGGAGQPRVQADLDATLRQERLGELRQRFRQLGQDQAAGVQEHHPDLLGPDAAEAAGGDPHEVVQLGHRLHAREPAPRHHEREQRASHGRVLLDVGLLQRVDEPVAQGKRIPQVLERQRILAQTGLAGKRRHGTERHHEVVEVQMVLPAAEPGGGLHAPVLEVDRLDGACVEGWCSGTGGGSA